MSDVHAYMRLRQKLITAIKQVRFEPFAGSGCTRDICVEHQLPAHAFEYIADAVLAAISSETWCNLPCEVNSIVHVVSRYYTGEWEIYEGRVASFEILSANTFMDIGTTEGYRFGVNVAEVGQTVFLDADRSKAEELRNKLRAETSRRAD